MGAVLAALAAASPATATNVSGPINTNTTWTLAGSPYVVTGNVTVSGTTSPVTLTIEAGVQVRFNANTALFVGSGSSPGTLRALGTASSRVLFTSNQAQPWTYVYFYSGSAATSVLEYVTVENGGASANGEITVTGGARPTLRNAIIRQSGGPGIYVQGGGLTIESITVENVTGPYAISMPVDTLVTSTGTHTFDKPIQLRPGTITSNVTWTALGTPYVLSGSCTIYNASGATLTVEPGVQVRFAANAALYVGNLGTPGTLRAVGTASSRVLFTSDQAQPWTYIYFYSGSAATSLLDYVTVENGGASQNGEIHINGGNPTLRNTIIRQSAGPGIYVQAGALTIDSIAVQSPAADYSISMPLDTAVTTTGTHVFDKPIQLRGGSITANATWKALGTPYVLSSSSSIYNTAGGSTLMVEPGVQVRMPSNTVLYVGSNALPGTLVTLGTPTAPVTFTANEAPPAPGSWGGLYFYPGAAGTSSLQYTIIEYAGRTYGTAIYVNGAAPTIFGGAVRQTTGDALYASGAAAPVVRGVSFSNNSGRGVNNAGSLTVDARACFWGDATGPSEAGPGAGQRITSKVAYSPWLESAPSGTLYATSGTISKFLFDVSNDATTFAATLNTAASWALTVIDSANSVRMTYTGTGSSISQAWNGEQLGTTAKVPPGLYQLRFTANLGSRPAAPMIGRVRTTNSNAPVAAIDVPVPDGVIPAGVPMSFHGTAADLNDFVSYRLEYGAGSTPTSWLRITPTDVTAPVIDGVLAPWTPVNNQNGVYTVRLTVNDASSPATVVQQPLRVIGIVNPHTSGPAFSPNGDGLNDTFIVTATLSLPANWTLTFKDGNGAVVRTYTGAGATSVNQAWDGNDASGANAPEGAYTFSLTAVEPGSGVAATPFTGTVLLDRTPPTAIITKPTGGQTVFNNIDVLGTASDPAFQSYTVEYGAGGNPSTWTTIATRTTPVTSALLATWATNSFIDEILVPGGNGTYTLRLTVRDTSGNSATAQVTVGLDNMLITSVIRTPTTIRPAAGESSTISFTINQPATVTVRIFPEPTVLGTYPDPTPEESAVRKLQVGSLPAGTHSVVWDGRNDEGNVVPDEAYIYIIEATAPSGRFDKFNKYLVDIATFSVAGSSIPAGEARCDPWKNLFFQHSFSMTGGPARGSTRVFYVNPPNPQVDIYPHFKEVWQAGANSAFWDCRDASGNIVINPAGSLQYAWIASVHEPWRGLKTNYILTQGTKPGLPRVSLKSDPYVIFLSYGHITHLRYQLGDPANVTVRIIRGIEQVFLVDNQPQAAGDREVIWDGLMGPNQLTPYEGDYVFLVTATNPATGFSSSARGNIKVYR